MADLLDIANAIINTPIVMPNSGPTISGWQMDEVKVQVINDSLPIRIMLPPGADGGSAVQAWEPVTYQYATVTWRLTELMLYQSIARGGGPKNIWSHLTQYIHQYIATFSAMANRKPAGALIVGFEPQAAVLEWPRDSRNQFHGVQMTVLVQENIC